MLRGDSEQAILRQMYPEVFGAIMLLHRGVATNFRLEGTDFDWGGGTNSGETKPPPPKLRFLLGFRPLYLGNI